MKFTESIPNLKLFVFDLTKVLPYLDVDINKKDEYYERWVTLGLFQVGDNPALPLFLEMLAHYLIYIEERGSVVEYYATILFPLVYRIIHDSPSDFSKLELMDVAKIIEYVYNDFNVSWEKDYKTMINEYSDNPTIDMESEVVAHHAEFLKQEDSPLMELVNNTLNKKK